MDVKASANIVEAQINAEDGTPSISLSLIINHIRVVRVGISFFLLKYALGRLWIGFFFWILRFPEKLTCFPLKFLCDTCEILVFQT
jgi:hypothetical protein